MRGQWIGRYEGSTGGEIILNVDELEEGYLSIAYLLPDDKSLPRVAASFQTPNKNSPFSLRTSGIYSFEPSGVVPLAWNDVKKHFPADMTFSAYADVKGEWDDKTLTLDWKSDLDAVGHSVLPRSKAGEPSEVRAQQMDWSQFKELPRHFKNPRAHIPRTVRAVAIANEVPPYRQVQSVQIQV